MITWQCISIVVEPGDARLRAFEQKVPSEAGFVRRLVRVVARGHTLVLEHVLIFSPHLPVMNQPIKVQTHPLSLSAPVARNLATATVTVPQTSEITPRWLLRLLPWVNVDGGVFRVNRRELVSPRSGRVKFIEDQGALRVEPISLRQVPALHQLEIPLLEALASALVVRNVNVDDKAARDQLAVAPLLIVADGKIEVSRSGPHGDHLREALLAGGDFHVEPSLFGIQTPQAKAVRALTPATVLVLEQARAESLAQQLSKQGIDLLGSIARSQELYLAQSALANEYGESRIDLLSGHSGEPPLPVTFVDYERAPREYHLSTIQTVLHTHTRVTDLYSNRIDQLREQIRLTVEAVREREEWELLNNPDFGLLNEVLPSNRLTTRSGPPTPDDLDELLAVVWKKPAFFLAHPKAIAAFGREATRRGVPPPTVQLFGSPFVTWRGVPLIPSNKLPVTTNGSGARALDTTSILLLRVGEAEQGVVGLHKVGVTGELEPGLSVRYMGTDEHSVASHLVTRYFAATVLTDDAIARLDDVQIGKYHDYP